ncbi:MAG TPA: Lrp/AsnC family transcriptional regulator [Candidatus Nanoarchaeia archaeon]|nr:Lrp/AsnC family transcriptional regulator [Candidatus Nanoarchaeia archaeon]
MKGKTIKTADYHLPLAYGSAFKFDQYDKLILKDLDENARKSLADLSKKVGLSRDAIRNRIKKLVDAKVILAFTPIYNPPRMGYPIINYVFISLYNPGEETEKEFLKFLKNNKYVTYVAGLIGKWDYILDIMAENPGQFDKILKEIRHKFADLIKDYEVYGVLQEHKYEEIGKLVYG